MLPPEVEGSLVCTCGHLSKEHKYWREDGWNSGECLIRRCPCRIYDDTEWDDEPEEEEEVIEDEFDPWDLI